MHYINRVSSEPIIFFNPHTNQLETEQVYGEGFLRWAYENPLGRATTWALVKRAWFSHWYGWRMNQSKSREKIAPFMQQYGVAAEEMVDNPTDFPHFNAFFSRRLKPSARPIQEGADQIVYPADGRHFAIPDVSLNDGIFVKGIPFDLAALVGDAALAEKYAGGALVISRLCPVDYHRFHFPVSGRVGEIRLLNGPLYSVSPIALRQRPTIFWENKRYITEVTSDTAGDVLLLEVGATCVGSVVHTAQPGEMIHKGDEKGYFLFGGSTFITVFQKGRVKLSEALLEQAAQNRELYGKMGEQMAVVV